MHAETHHHQVIHSNKHHTNGIKWSFFFDGIKSFLPMILRELRLLNMFAYKFYFLSTFFTEFVMSYTVVQTIVGVISGPIIIYLFGTYLTTLPNHIVFALMFFPKKIVIPFLFLVMCFNFFNAFSI